MANDKKYGYEEILESFGEQKVAERFEAISSQMTEFIKIKGYEENVVINDGILEQALIDYFTDIFRLKQFHDIDFANYVKITAYTSYWLLRRKPLQIIKDLPDDPELCFINENFVAAYIQRFLQQKVKKGNSAFIVDQKDREAYEEFSSILSYFLRYRNVTAQAIELMIEGFIGGAIAEKAHI